MGEEVAVAEYETINAILRDWRQGDVSLDQGLGSVHLADPSRPHSTPSTQAVQRLEEQGLSIPETPTPIVDTVPGIVVLSQTCVDVVRDCQDRPYVEVAPLVQLPHQTVHEIKLLKRPAFAYVPATAERLLVADLDRPMTVEKAIIASWTRIPGWSNEHEIRDFALALSRKRSRFAFPDDFVRAAQDLQRRLVDKHRRRSSEGSHVRALREIRVQALPSWNEAQVRLRWWFIKDHDPHPGPTQWSAMGERWTGLFDQTHRFRIDSYDVRRLEDMTALEYVDSVRLDLDHLSISRE